MMSTKMPSTGPSRRSRLISSLIVMALAVAACGEHEPIAFSCSPSRPELRDEVSIRYRPDLAGPALRKAESIAFRFALVGGGGEMYSAELPMTHRGAEWDVRFRPSDLVSFDPVLMVCAVLDSDAPEYFDNDGGKPWVVDFVRNGETLPGRAFQMFRLAAGETGVPDPIRLPMDGASIQQSIDAAVAEDPEFLPARSAVWCARLLETRPGSDEFEALREPIRTDLDSIFANIMLEGKPDATAVSLLELYRMIDESERGDSVVAEIRARFPGSRLALLAESEWAHIRWAAGEEEPAKEFVQAHPDAPEAQRLRDALIRSVLGDDERLDDGLRIVENEKPVTADYVYALARSLLGAGRLDESEDVARRSLEIWKSESRPEESPMSVREWNEEHRQHHAVYAYLLALVSAEKGNAEEAVRRAEEAVAAAGDGADADMLAHQAAWLEKVGRRDDALAAYVRLAERYPPDSLVVSNWRRLVEEDPGRTGADRFDERLDACARVRRDRTMERLARKVLDTPAPDASLRDPSGEVHRLTDYLGSVVVLDFWATWCPSCMASLPALDGVYRSYADQRDLVFAAVNTMEGGTRDERREAIRQRWDALGLSVPVLLDAGMEDENVGESAATKFRIHAIPRTIIIGRSGRILFNKSGWGDDGDTERLKSMIDFALRRPS